MAGWRCRGECRRGVAAVRRRVVSQGRSVVAGGSAGEAWPPPVGEWCRRAGWSLEGGVPTRCSPRPSPSDVTRPVGRCTGRGRRGVIAARRTLASWPGRSGAVSADHGRGSISVIAVRRTVPPRPGRGGAAHGDHGSSPHDRRPSRRNAPAGAVACGSRRSRARVRWVAGGAAAGPRGLCSLRSATREPGATPGRSRHCDPVGLGGARPRVAR